LPANKSSAARPFCRNKCHHKRSTAALLLFLRVVLFHLLLLLLLKDKAPLQTSAFQAAQEAAQNLAWA
jgi:hypothetical protein